MPGSHIASGLCRPEDDVAPDRPPLTALRGTIRSSVNNYRGVDVPLPCARASDLRLLGRVRLLGDPAPELVRQLSCQHDLGP